MGHCLKIFDAAERRLEQERACSTLPKFDLFGAGVQQDARARNFLSEAKYQIDCNGWRMEGNFMEWDYSILSGKGTQDCRRFQTTMEFGYNLQYYVYRSERPTFKLFDAGPAIDAEKCSKHRSSS